MLDVVRIDNQVLDLKMEIMAVSSLTNRIQADFESFLENRKLTLRLQDIEGLPLVKGDSGLLLKVLQNVVINAIKYTPDGGEITISGRRAQDPQYGECVELLVQDTGIGIDTDHQELIFEKFYSTGSVALHSSGKTTFKGGGPGLGLSIARGIILAHRGRIWVESPGYNEAACPGSCFHILLPIIPAG
jgi:signal transduction histidine kinase